MRSSLARFAALLCCILLAHARSGAETVDQVVNPKRASNTWVSDMARVLDEGTQRKLNGLINGLERRTGAEMAVVTVQQTDGLEPKPFATALFNRWGIGKRGSDNGVLLLLVMDARRVEVETGNGMEQILPDDRVQQILNERAVPRFRAGDYSAGILASAQEIIRDIDRSHNTRIAAAAGGGRKKFTPNNKSKNKQAGARTWSRPRVTPTRTAAPRAASRTASSAQNSRYNDSSEQPGRGVGWMPLAAGALLLPLGVWGAMRSRVRHCPSCKQKMQRLSEVEDDALLAFEQKFEEDLGSVDYRAWKCGSCGATTIERAVKWLSGYGDCPRCSHRTVSSQTTILRHSTYSSHGESLTTRTCRFPRCNFRDEERRTLPLKTRPTHHSSSHSSGHSSSSSSSSGSFGGGSSSGGGAGASW